MEIDSDFWRLVKLKMGQGCDRATAEKRAWAHIYLLRYLELAMEDKLAPKAADLN